MPDLKVFDSWALLAWLLDQPAASRVEALLHQAEQSRCWANVGEVYYIASRKFGAARAEEFLQIARISYADGFAATPAQNEGASL